MTDAASPFLPASGTESAAWLVESLSKAGFAESVASLVPGGYAAYARIFHPAYRLHAGVRRPVRWTALAAQSGRVAHPLMQFDNIVAPNSGGKESTGLEFPDEGSLPTELAIPLTEVLESYTGSAPVYYAVWVGFGCLDRVVRSSATFDIPGRRMYLMNAPLEAMKSSLCAKATNVSTVFHQSANLVWSANRAWCLASEIDLNSSYLGGSRELIRSVLNQPDLEVLNVTAEDEITALSDRINPRP